MNYVHDLRAQLMNVQQQQHCWYARSCELFSLPTTAVLMPGINSNYVYDRYIDAGADDRRFQLKSRNWLATRREESDGDDGDAWRQLEQL